MKKFKKLLLATFLAGFLGLTVTACGGGGGSGAAPTVNPPSTVQLPYTSEQANYLRQNAPNIPGAESLDIDSNGGSITVIFGPNFTREDFLNLLTVLERLADGGVPPPPAVTVTCPDGSTAATLAGCPSPPLLTKSCPNGVFVLLTEDCPIPPIELPDISSPVACADTCPTGLLNGSAVSYSVSKNGESIGFSSMAPRIQDQTASPFSLPQRTNDSRRSGRVVAQLIQYDSRLLGGRGAFGNVNGQFVSRDYRDESFDFSTDDDYLDWGVWNRPNNSSTNAAFVVGAPLPDDYQLPKSGSAIYDGKSEFYLVGRDSQTDAIQQTAGSQTGRVRFIVEFNQNDTIMEGFLIQAQNNFQLTFGATTYSNGKFVSDIDCGNIGTCADAPSGGELEAAFFGKGAANGAPTKMGGVFSADGFRRLGDVDNANIVGSFGARLLE